MTISDACTIELSGVSRGHGASVESQLTSTLDSIQSSKTADIRILSWLDDASVRSAFDRQRRLAQLVGKSIALNSHRLLDKPAPAKLIIDYAGLECVTTWQLKATPAQTLGFAFKLYRGVTSAVAAGLVHGSLSTDCVFAGKNGEPLIDYLSCFYQPVTSELPTSDAQEAASLHEVLSSILREKLRQGDFDSLLARPLRAALSRLCQPLTPTDCPLNNLGFWDQWFSRYSNEVEASKNAPPPTTIQDQTCEVEVVLRDDVNVNNVVPVSDLGLDDATCEVQVQSLADSSSYFDSDTTTDVQLAPTDANSLPECTIAVGDRIGRFQIQSLLGSGGMGTVYKALDLSSDETIALKILKTHGGDATHAIRRFKKEARILSAVQNQFVTRLIDAGIIDGRHYIAMEFVDGTNLKDWLRTRLPLDETTSLQLIADIASALNDAHQQNIIHRDIKPENVLLQRMPPKQQPSEVNDLLQDYAVKLTDFGIARSIDQSASMDVTRAGSLLGTPLFMAPEQCKGTNALTPAADVYSLGITLYLLLCGEPPFQSDDPMKLAAMHCFETPCSIQKKNSAISDPTAAILHQMLAKDPKDRFADAGQLLRAIRKLQGGEPGNIQLHPRLPDSSDAGVWEKVMTWDCESTAEELWPMVSNTERLNRAAGLQSVQYRTEKKPEGGVRRFGAIRIAGMSIEWEEHPFEWIEGYRMGVLREFNSGPFVWFTSVVQVEPNLNGGTKLTHTVRIKPRNAIGWGVATVEAGWKAGRALDRVYRRIDRTLQSSKRHLSSSDSVYEDPFEMPLRLKSSQRRRIEQRVERMVELGVKESLANKLADFITQATPQVLARIRPSDLSTDLKIASADALDVCLVAAKCGLLVMKWEILCPTCRVPTATKTLLEEIDEHTECEACDLSFQSNIANAIELVFQADPEIAKVDQAPYCVGGPRHTPHVLSQMRLAPNESIEIILSLSVGDYIIRGPALTRTQTLQVRAGVSLSHFDARLGQLGISSHSPIVRTGRVSIVLTNDFDFEQIIRVERTAKPQGVVTAAVASTLPRFRELFPEQTFKRNLPVESEQLTLMGIRVANIAELTEKLGEAEAYLTVQAMLNSCENLVQTMGGAVVKSLGEWILASFRDSVDATLAAVNIANRERDSLQEIDEPKVAADLGIAIHRGSVLVATQNGRLDYFGATVRILENLVNHANRQIYLSDAVFADEEVRDLLHESKLNGATELQSTAQSQQILVQKIDILNRDK